MQLPIRSNRPAFLLALVLIAAAARAETDLPVYTDQLNSGFDDWSWLPHSLNNTSPVHSGSFSIKVSPPANPSGWPALWLRHRNFDTTAYTNISFWANGGDPGGQVLQMRSMLGTNPQSIYLLPPLPSNEWRQFVVPLALLNAQDKTNFQGVWFQMHGTSETNPFFLDDIKLVATPVAAPVPPPMNAVTAAETPPREAESGWSAAAWCIAGALIAITLLLTWLIVMLRRSGLGTARALLPAPAPSPPQISLTSEAEPVADSVLKTRVLEASADPEAQALRDKMAIELAEFAKQSLVQGLYSQRSKLIEAQQKAQAELAELEARLSSLHLPLQERIRAYELRIGELEKELETRDEEMRHMTRATLLLVRERLEQEKAKDQTTSRFN